MRDSSPGTAARFLTLLLAGCSGATPSPVETPRAQQAEPPPAPDAPPTFVEIAAGRGYTCARRSDGLVACWGRNEQHQLGHVTQERERLPPMALANLSATQITTGHGHACALREDGGVSCWGANGEGQLGDGGYDWRGAPTPVPDVSDVVQVSAGGAHTCARRENGSVLCWGLNRSGQLGDGSRDNRRSPVVVPGLVANEIAAGGRHTCALVEGGGVVCWGASDEGQLGDGGPARQSSEPSPAQDLADVVALSAGSRHTCALRDDGTVACWGSNVSGTLGSPETTASSSRVPVDVAGLDDAIAVVAGAYHSCAIRRGGTIACWGAGGHGRLGDGEAHPTRGSQPLVAVAGLTDARSVAVGQDHSCSASADGRVTCWGFNRLGQLGSTDVEDQLAPVVVEGLDDAERTGEELGLGYTAPPRVRVPEMMGAAVAEGFCEPSEGGDPEYVYEGCFRRLAARDEARAGFLFGRLEAERCRWEPICAAKGLRRALLFEDDPATLALVREAARVASRCVDGGDVPEGARTHEVEGADGLVFFYRPRDQSQSVTDGNRTCELDLQWGRPRRAQRDGSRVLIELIDSAVGHDEGCTNEDDTHRVTVIDFALGELLTLPTGRFFESECVDERPSRTRRARPRPVQVRLRGDTLTVGRSASGMRAAPTTWLLGQTLTLRDGVFTLPRGE